MKCQGFTGENALRFGLFLFFVDLPREDDIEWFWRALANVYIPFIYVRKFIPHLVEYNDSPP